MSRVWTQRFDSAALLWGKAFRRESMSRHDYPTLESAAHRFADELLLVADFQEAREQIQRDPKGACSFAAFLHEASDRIRAGELLQPPVLSEEHMPFYLPVFGVNELFRYRATLRRGRDYHPEPPPHDS